ncbi:hypothetical protein CMUS01_00473 [Colletotrichum musicola]|uniref:Uncharacterized protein n=1 Tax=Colletotrichum musicola TaxID=2175873 RepID=A0A8H6U8X8_9PEZI|nr:hypothetical protein CMUS01_00473 [Colletotrichum musicola]
MMERSDVSTQQAVGVSRARLKQEPAQNVSRRREEEAGVVGGRFQFGPDDGFMSTADGGAAIDRKWTPGSKFSSARY